MIFPFFFFISLLISSLEYLESAESWGAVPLVSTRLGSGRLGLVYAHFR